MHYFRYSGNKLFCENVFLGDIAKKYGTPLYVYSHRTLIEHYRKLKKAFRSVSPLICFSMKANSNLSICRSLVKEGAGLDIVSGGELFKALKTGVHHRKIVYASVGKTRNEIRAALKAGILFFNVESIPELKLINEVAYALKQKAAVCLRVNPNVDAHTHKFITTGRSLNKFGLDIKTAKELFLKHRLFPNVKLLGVHIHIGSQITQAGPFVAAIKRAVSLIQELKKEHLALEYINIGGGLGIIYKNEKPQTAQEFAKAVLPILKSSGLKIILEPGRFIVGSAGVLLSRVTYIKRARSKNFIILDAGMNDLIRPALYEAHHEILPVRLERTGPRSAITADIVGPVCESGDFFAKARKIQEPLEGDYLALMGAGAYGYSMSSNYNARPRAAEVMVKGGKPYLVRRRETYKDLAGREVIPAFLK
ncbi:MAG: diaminopimelate decarboxylase [Candidatus Omnitrophota bacterium]